MRVVLLGFRILMNLFRLFVCLFFLTSLFFTAIMLLLAVVFFFSLSFAQPCTEVVASERVILEGFGLNCSFMATCAYDFSGHCRVVTIGVPLSFGASALTAVSMTSLQSINGSLTFAGTLLQSINIPSLSFINGSLYFSGNINLASPPQIGTSTSSTLVVNGDINIDDASPNVVTSFLGVGSITGSLVVTSSAAVNVSFPTLQNIGMSLVVQSASSLVSINFPSLQTIGG